MAYENFFVLLGLKTPVPHVLKFRCILCSIWLKIAFLCDKCQTFLKGCLPRQKFGALRAQNFSLCSNFKGAETFYFPVLGAVPHRPPPRNVRHWLGPPHSPDLLHQNIYYMHSLCLLLLSLLRCLQITCCLL